MASMPGKASSGQTEESEVDGVAQFESRVRSRKRRIKHKPANVAEWRLFLPRQADLVKGAPPSYQGLHEENTLLAEVRRLYARPLEEGMLGELHEAAADQPADVTRPPQVQQAAALAWTRRLLGDSGDGLPTSAEVTVGQWLSRRHNCGHG